MTDTVLTSATKEVVIGFDRPFVVIGERINPTGRKLFQEQLRAGDLSAIETDVAAQVAGLGCGYLPKFAALIEVGARRLTVKAVEEPRTAVAAKMPRASVVARRGSAKP